MDMKPLKIFVARAIRIEDEWAIVDLLDNSTLRVTPLGHKQMPDYIEERIALLRMCDVNKTAKGETIGRRTSDTQMLVYLSYDEYIELINLKSKESAK